MRIVGAPWFDLSFLKERQLFAKEEILRGKSVAGTGREETSPPRSSSATDVVRRRCLIVATMNAEMNTQDRTLRDVTIP